MIRTLITLIAVVLAYQAIKIIIRSAVAVLRAEEGGGRSSAGGEDMAKDPNCGTYVVKGRAISRRVRGATQYFCSAACADEFERKRIV